MPRPPPRQAHVDRRRQPEGRRGQIHRRDALDRRSDAHGPAHGRAGPRRPSAFAHPLHREPRPLDRRARRASSRRRRSLECTKAATARSTPPRPRTKPAFAPRCGGFRKPAISSSSTRPGGDSYLARLAHACADTLITPLNDSFVDFDLLGDIDPNCADIVRPSIYSEMVWESRKRKALAARTPIDWVVLRNRTSASRIEAKNKQKVGRGADDALRPHRLPPGPRPLRAGDLPGTFPAGPDAAGSRRRGRARARCGWPTWPPARSSGTSSSP